MKEEFLALVEKVKATGIADALCNANTRDEREIVLAKFGKENQGIIREIASWGKKFDYDEPLFNEGEKVQNPLEIAICILISDIVESDIFEDFEDLQFAIRNLGSEYAVKFASAMDKFCIEEIEFSDPSNERFKEEFLALVERVKATGIADALCNANTVDERVRAWTKFEKENKALFRELVSWGEKFDEDYGPIFNEGEKIQNPLEIAVCISISGATEDDIFEDCEDLQFAIRNLGNGYATDFADAMDEDYIVDIDITEPIWEDED